MDEKVPIWRKPFLTIPEASSDFNIGEKKIRYLLCEFSENGDELYIRIGNKFLVKRERFCDFLTEASDL